MTFAKYPVGGGGSGSGDVVGPGLSTDNAVVLWNGTSGQSIKNSSVLVSDLVLITGNQTIAGTKTFSSAVVINPTTNQIVLGVTNTVTINSPAPSASRVLTIPDPGADASFVMTAGTQTVGGAKTFSTAVTINPTTNQLVLGVTNTTTINSVAPTASRTYTIIDAGGAADFVMTAATQTIGGAKTFSTAVTINPASNQLVLSTGVNALTLNSGTSAAGRTYTVPDVGTSSSFVMTTGNQSIAGNKIFTSFITSTASSDQIALHSGVNQLVINSGTSAAARTYSFPDVGTTGTIAMLQGAQTFAGAKTFSSAVTINPASNQIVLSSGVNQLTLNSSTSAAARVYSFPDVGTTGTVAMLEGAQTFSALKTFSSGLNVSGGTAANGSIWFASNVLRQRGGTSGWAVDNTSGTAIISATDAGEFSLAPRSVLSLTGATDQRLSFLSNTASGEGFAIVSKASTLSGNRGLSIYSMGQDADQSGDMVFDVRTSANAAFTTTTFDAFRFRHAGATIMSATRAGAWTLGAASSSNLNLAVNGRASVTHGLTFPASANLSADVNTLDDYEEGTFTPIMTGTTLNGVGTYTAQQGQYTKIGDLVYFTLFIEWSAHTGTGTMRIGQLPFTSKNVANGFHNVFNITHNNLTHPANSIVAAYIPPNTSYMELFTFVPGASARTLLAVDTACGFYISGTYQAAT